MAEEEYWAEVTKQARLANLIAMRALCRDSASFASRVGVPSLDEEIITLAFVS